MTITVGRGAASAKFAMINGKKIKKKPSAFMSCRRVPFHIEKIQLKSGQGQFGRRMKAMIFHVEAAGKFRPVELTFATEVEVRRVRAWRKMTPATDAGEFAALAAKRWFYYTREGATVASLGDLRAAIKRKERAELAFLLVATAKWVQRYKFLALA